MKLWSLNKRSIIMCTLPGINQQLHNTQQDKDALLIIVFYTVSQKNCASVIFSSFKEWAHAMARRLSSVCLSVCPCVCKLFCGNRYYDAKNSSIATKLAQNGHPVGAHPRCAQGRGQGQRSPARGSFVLERKMLLLRGKWLDCDQTCTWWSPGAVCKTLS